MMKYGILLVLPCPVFPDRLLADGPVRDSLGKGGHVRPFEADAYLPRSGRTAGQCREI